MFRSLLFSFIFFSVNSNAQNFYYSAPVGNYPYADFKIIGRVKNNIIIHNYTWSHAFDMRKSEILVYNDEMRLLNRVSFKSLTSQYSSVDFINEENSFSAIVQCSENGFFVCKLISFDPDGNVLRSQVLERSTVQSDGPYEIIKSTKDKSFVLLRVLPSYSSGAITIQYHFVRNDLLNHSDKIILPFNSFSSRLCKALLDDNNLIIPVNDATVPRGSLALFKVNLTNNSSINSIRSLADGYLVSPGIGIDENDKYYAVTSEWAPGNDSSHAAKKIFLWQLEKDLTDITTDTIFNIDSLNPCLQNFFYYQVNSVAFENNSSNIIISTEDMAADNGTHFFAPAHNSHVPATSGGSFYEGRVLSMTPLKELNGNGYYTWANIGHGPTWSNNTDLISNYGSGNRIRKKNSQIPAIAVLNIDAQNNLNWMQCFDVSMEKDFKALLNESLFLKMQKSMHIIYLKSVPGGKQALGDIILSPDGNYTIKPIISMNLKYKYWLKQSVQIDSNAVIVPCIIRGKVAFAKLRIE